MASFFEKGLAGAAKMGGQYLMATSLSDHKAKIQVARDKTLEDYAMARQEDQQSHALALVAAEAEALKATPGYKLQANELARDEQLDGLWAQFLGAEEGSQEQAKIENQITLLNRKGGRRATDLVVVGDGVLSRRKSEQLIAQGKSIKGAWTQLGNSESEFNALVVKETNAEYNSLKAIKGPRIGLVPEGVTRESIAAVLRPQLRAIFFHRDKTAEDVPPPPGDGGESAVETDEEGYITAAAEIRRLDVELETIVKQIENGQLKPGTPEYEAASKEWKTIEIQKKRLQGNGR